ncbi:stromal interaction molecule homolog isoform X2 [Chrysoperla carnea]|uniref:stromal interaction molecule homolog isoform X2 n=1 Tax=Chrysoperla carnea TaxID=189513 RepID=UPI001D085958|nr:stromal interaction molecule homolog isoform X2 [Chrysoperla carnea]
MLSDQFCLGKKMTSQKFLFILYFWAICGICQYTANIVQEQGSSPATNYKLTSEKPPPFSGVEGCNDDIACLTMASHDRLGLEAIKSLHQQLDDDANGAVDLSESDDFLREELKYASDYERRQKAFHYNDDTHVSVRELWEAWLRSEVHNWTVEQTSEWLAMHVELPQYVPTFIQHRVTGATLPRLAVHNMHYLSNVLGIKDPIHKQKISLKAMDVVLFGPPKDSSHHWKDWILVSLLIGALTGCYYTYKQHTNSRKHLNRMMRDMESLHKAEIDLENLQKELERARLEQESVTTEKQNLEKRLQEAGGDNTNLHTSYSDLEVSQLKAEIEMLRGELQRAEGELEDRCWSAPIGLQHWLQLTHELENKQYIKKKMAAEKQLQQAREACEKLRKKRTSLVGAFVSTHGKSIDDVDRSIVEARTSLNEVTQELQERVHRWKQIELLCGFSIINNSGLTNLENMLYNKYGPGNRNNVYRGRLSNSQDDLDDDTGSLCGGGGATGYYGNVAAWRDNTQDSSGSENGKYDDDNSESQQRPPNNTVQFLIGDEVSTPEIREENIKSSKIRQQSMPYQLPQPPPRRTNSGNNIPPAGPMVRSYSQDTNIATLEAEPTALSKQACHSETCLDNSKSSPSQRSLPNMRINKAIIKDQPLTINDDDFCSTDSSIVDEEIKRRRRKIHFPAFAKKSRSKD